MILAGCSTEKKAETKAPVRDKSGIEYEELKFVPDPTLLGFVYPDTTLRIQFAPPRGWPPLEPELFEQVQAEFQKLAPKDNRYVATPVRIFYEKDRRLFMIVSRFQSWPDLLSPQAAIAQYRQLVMTAMPEAEMSDGFFRSGKVTGYRLLLRNNVMVNFRVLVMHEGRSPVQINYLVPRALFPELQKPIEASVGSISYL